MTDEPAAESAAAQYDRESREALDAAIRERDARRHPCKPAWALGVSAVCVFIASIAVSDWGDDYESYLQMRATVLCAPAPTSVAWQPALAVHCAEAGLVTGLILSIVWCRRRMASRTHLAWTAVGEAVLILMFLYGILVVVGGSGLDPAGYIPMCGEGP